MQHWRNDFSRRHIQVAEQTRRAMTRVKTLHPLRLARPHRLRRRLAGNGDDQVFLFGRDVFFSSSGFVGEPGADQFFVHFLSAVGIKELPEFVMFVKSISPLGDAMCFDSVLILNLVVGEIFGVGEDTNRTRRHRALFGID